MDKRRSKLKKGLLSICLLIIALLSFSGKQCQAAQKTVRVGIFQLGKFMGFDDAGTAVGYNVDYLEKIAQKNHWKYKYVKCENWIDATTKLESGAIDLLAPAQITDELSAKFGYTTNNMGIEAAAIYTNSSRTDLTYEDFDEMKNLTYGVAKGSTFAKKFVSEYAKKNGLKPKIKEYANTTELSKAIQDKKVDAIVTNIMFYSDDLKMLGWFTPMKVYYITQKNDSELIRQMDNAMSEIMVEEPEFQANLESKYFPVFSNTQLTYEERQYVKKLSKVTVGYVTDRSPISYKDEKTGEFKGITRDLLDRISKNTGIEFEYVALPTRNVTASYLKQQKIYVVTGVESNDITTAMSALHLTTPYISSEKVLVSDGELKFNSKSKLTIAVASESTTLNDTIKSAYPNFTIQNYDSVKECFEAVRTGNVDATIQNRYVADSILDNPLYNSLTVSSAQVLSDELSIATVEVDARSTTCEQINDSLFISVVDKGINQITNEQKNNIIIKNTANQRYQYSVLDFMKKYAPSIAAISILVCVVIILFIYLQRVTSIKNSELEKKNDQLGDAVAQAERANNAKSQFLSSMSHEIRTPMNAIVGLTNIAKQHENEPGKMDDYLTKIDISSKVLLNIINDVLDMSAIESNKLKIDQAEFDMKQVLSSISTIYYPQCKDKGITFSVAVDMENELLIGDSLRVNQILMNLVSNAYKFTESGGTIKINVQETARKDKKAFVRFIVSDTGCGMSKEMLGRLFQPFEQETAGTAKKHGGSGLGLSIAKNLVDMMHGAIKVDSIKGEGTTFTVDLPFELTGNETKMTDEILNSVHILVVDDDESSREYTGIVLKRIGVEYDIANSGKKALMMIDQAKENGNPYSVCLVDWKMPDMDGVEVTRRIREGEDEKTLIIIVSAYDLNEVEDEAKAAGADHFVPKPLFQSTVFNILMTLTNGQFKTESAKPEEYDFTGHKVLLAEDNEMNSEIAIELLGMVNLEVEHAENGKIAVDMFEQNEPGTYGAILMDVQMPVMDGYEASKAIRNSARKDGKEIPIYAMTANAFTEDVSAALSAGMDGHIAKPIDTEVLYETLAKVLLK